MTDRELLELAAKAGGYDVVWNKHWQCFQHRNPSPDKFGNVRHPWVPLDDDGDALRLAVKLRLQVYPNDYDTMVNGRLPLRITAAETHNNDPCAATRRAIVRAAAEIGRSL